MTVVIYLIVIVCVIGFVFLIITQNTPEPSHIEKARQEARALWHSVPDHNVPDVTEALGLVEQLTTRQHFHVQYAITECFTELALEARRTWREPDFDTLDLVELSRIRKQVPERRAYYENAQDQFESLIYGLMKDVYTQLPKTENPSPFTIPFIYAFPDAKFWISLLFARSAENEHQETGMWQTLRHTLYENICHVSGIDPTKPATKPLKHARDSKMSLMEVNDAYLRDTPFHDMFEVPVPLKLTYEDRFNHMHLLGGTNAGKTTVIQKLILHDLEQDDPPSIVLIDPHGDLIKTLMLSRNVPSEKLIYIDPRDVEYPPALNIFALNRERMKGYSQAAREQVVAGVIETYEYLFEGFGIEMTGKQQVLFRNSCRVLISLPDTTLARNATIIDMIQLMVDPAPYHDAIMLLPEFPRQFFLRDFISRDFAQTREQIRYRLQAIVENPTLARLFTTVDTKIDLFTELNRGSIILVDTAKDFLKKSSPIFGRLFISLVLQAVLERSVIAQEKRKPTFLYIDEAASFFDTNISDMLSEVRKYACGLVLSHQYLDQATSQLRAALNANTGIKFVSGVSASDARTLASEMRTTPDFILDQPRYQFAAFIKGVTPQAISIPIERPEEPSMRSMDELEDLLEDNRATVSLGPPQEQLTYEPDIEPEPVPQPQPEAESMPVPIVVSIKPKKPAPTPQGIPDEEISKTW